MVCGKVDEQLLLRIEYLVAENGIVRDQITGRLHLSNAERRTLAEIGKKLDVPQGNQLNLRNPSFEDEACREGP